MSRVCCGYIFGRYNLCRTLRTVRISIGAVQYDLQIFLELVIRKKFNGNFLPAIIKLILLSLKLMLASRTFSICDELSFRLMAGFASFDAVEPVRATLVFGLYRAIALYDFEIACCDKLSFPIYVANTEFVV